MALIKREILKKQVKVKLDELSPFDNLHGDDSVQDFIAADGDSDYSDVNPISSYIENTLDAAANFCLNDLPLTLLASDIDSNGYHVKIDCEGVGYIEDWEENTRLARLSIRGHVWSKDVTDFITTSDPLYCLQQKRWTRGGAEKPVVAYSPECQRLELFSFPMHPCCVTATVSYIDCGKKADSVASKIEDYIALRCASYVLEILGDEDKAAILIKEYENKKKGILQ